MSIFKSFNDLPSLYADMIHDSGTESLFSSREWFENYIKTVVPDKERVSILAKSSDGTIDTAIVFPLYDEGSVGFFAPRKLYGLTNYYASRFEPIVGNAKAFPSKSLQDLVLEIATARPGWDVVDISPSRSDGVAIQQLADAFSMHGWAIQPYHCFKNLYLENIYDDFGSYLSSRSTRIRKTAANRVRKFDRDESNTFQIITSVDEIDSGIELFSELYRKRWKKDEPFPDFLPNLARMCAENGWLRLGIASVNGRPGAVQFWIVREGVAYIYKVAYDEEFTKMSVGAVALYKMFEHVIDNENVREIDFLTGDDAYKRDWMSESRELVGLVAFNKRTVRGIAAACWHLGGKAAKDRLATLAKKKFG